MRGIIDMGVENILLSYIFVLLVLFIIVRRGLRREKEILISSIRMTVQLMAAGYIIGLVMTKPNPAVTVAIILLMETFAIFTVFGKFKGQLSHQLKKTIALSISIGTLSCLFYYLFVVVKIDPWYDPQYFIPIAGMLIGNSMTGISLGTKSLIDGMTIQRNYVEEALVLGATPKTASKTIVDSAFDAAIMPTMNSMVGMGIVFLPGMMTGQILSGTVPTTAVVYQISVMFGILGAVSLSVILLVQWGYRSFFNEEDQLLWRAE